MGGGGMLRAVGKVVGAGVGGVQEVVSRSNTTAHKRPTTSNPRSLPSSSLASSRNLPVLATSATAPTWLSSSPSHCFCDGDEWEWEPVDGIEDERVNGFYYSSRYALGSVPSMDEVQDAISSLRHTKQNIKPNCNGFAPVGSLPQPRVLSLLNMDFHLHLTRMCCNLINVKEFMMPFVYLKQICLLRKWLFHYLLIKLCGMPS